jgi:hypothetical protein
VQARCGPYIAYMKNRNLHYPTTAELYAFEREARRLRAEEAARLISAGFNAVRSLFKTTIKRLQHA